MADFIILDNDKNVDTEKDVNNKKILSFMDDLLHIFKKVNLKDKIQFFRLLSVMLNSWLSLVKAVRILEEQQKPWNFKNILSDFIVDLAWWKKLSDCMLKYSRDFSEAEVWMVKAWEKNWKLNSVLLDLSVQLERLNSISWKLKSALIYPFFIVLVVIWVIYVLMVKVVPELLSIFWDQSKLPSSTQTLIGVSDFLRSYSLHIFLFLIVWYIFLFFWKKTPRWLYMFDSFTLKVPIFWSILRKIVLSKFSRVFSWLVESWVSVVESLRITSEVVWNEVYKQRILLLIEDIAWWIKIFESLESDKLFPNMMTQMIQVWEETAKLQDTVSKVADYYDEEVDNVVASINKLIEPFIIVTLAIVVWFIAVSILEPIMNLADTVWG